MPAVASSGSGIMPQSEADNDDAGPQGLRDSRIALAHGDGHRLMRELTCGRSTNSRTIRCRGLVRPKVPDTNGRMRAPAMERALQTAACSHRLGPMAEEDAPRSRREVRVTTRHHPSPPVTSVISVVSRENCVNPANHRRPARRLAFLLLGLCGSGAALAHPGHEIAGFGSGLAHPFSGYDHYLTMLAVGLWAWQQRRRSAVHLWTLPLAFAFACALSGAYALLGGRLAGVELLPVVSLFLLGGLLALKRSLRLCIAGALLLLLGGAHGYLHGAEMPRGGHAWAYGSGFVAATLLLHGLGIAAGAVARTLRLRWVLPAAGYGLAAAGCLAAIA